MAKVVLVRKDYVVGEITRFEVSHVCFPHMNPGKCPEHNIYVEMDVEPMMHDKTMVDGAYKFSVDVNVSETDGADKHLEFKAVSGLIEKATEEIKTSPEYIAYIDAKRKDEYEKRVDSLVLEKIRKSLSDAEIDAIVESIKAEFPK